MSTIFDRFLHDNSWILRDSPARFPCAGVSVKNYMSQPSGTLCSATPLPIFCINDKEYFNFISVTIYYKPRPFSSNQSSICSYASPVISLACLANVLEVALIFFVEKLAL